MCARQKGIQDTYEPISVDKILQSACKNNIYAQSEVHPTVCEGVLVHVILGTQHCQKEEAQEGHKETIICRITVSLSPLTAAFSLTYCYFGNEASSLRK